MFKRKLALLVISVFALHIKSVNAELINLGSSVEVDKELLVGPPVYIRNGIIELTYYLKVTDGKHSTFTNKTTNIAASVYDKNAVTYRTVKYNSFTRVLNVDCNNMTGKELSRTWYYNGNVVGRNYTSEYSKIININPGTDIQKVASYQCEHAIPLRKYNN